MEDVARARTVAHRANAQCQQLDRNRTPFRSTYLYIYTLKILSRGKSQLFLIFLTFFLIFIYFCIFFYVHLYIFIRTFVYFYTRIYIFLYAEKVPLCCARHPVGTTVPGDTPSPVLKKTNRCFLCCFCAVFVCLGVENAPQLPKNFFPTDYAFLAIPLKNVFSGFVYKKKSKLNKFS